MAKRYEAIDFMALGLDKTVEAVLNVARMLKNAPAPYGTSIGRGRDSEVLAEWTNSLFFGLSIDDAKNAAVKVPEMGNLRLDLKASSLIHRSTKVHGNELNFSAPSTETSTELPGIENKGYLSDTLFETFLNFTREVGCNWNGELHNALKDRFELALNLGDNPWAEFVLSVSKKHDAKWLMRGVYTLDTPRKPVRFWQNPIQRRSVINVRHIEMLAVLYADTMRKAGGFDSDDVPAPSIEEMIAEDSVTSDATPASDSPENDGASSPAREPAPSRAYDVPMDQTELQSADQFCSRDDSLKQATASEPMRESKNAQALSDCITGRPLQLFRDHPRDRTQADFRRSTRACA